MHIATNLFERKVRHRLLTELRYHELLFEPQAFLREINYVS